MLSVNPMTEHLEERAGGRTMSIRRNQYDDAIHFELWERVLFFLTFPPYSLCYGHVNNL